jgi:predicted 2-oxoglutarate/Fe(II)-dependent dioxygenase YbiX
MQYFKNLLSPDTVDQAFDVYRTLPNFVELDGSERDRHSIASIGSFMLSSFTSDELGFVWEEISNKLDHLYVPKYFRILKYTKGCYISEHIDTYAQGQKTSDHSLIIQMNDPNSFAGGIPSVNGKMLYLGVGDAVMYEYGEPHAVSTVRKGVRYVINLRLESQ